MGLQCSQIYNEEIAMEIFEIGTQRNGYREGSKNMIMKKRL
jgi:hypothetical protein